MNRIELRYDKSVTPHTLEVRNDIKGVTNELLKEMKYKCIRLNILKEVLIMLK